MKKVFSIFLLTTFFFAYSCKKCMICTYDFAGEHLNTGEFCGSKKELDGFESKIKSKVEEIKGENLKCERK